MNSLSLPHHIFRLLGRQHTWVARPVSELEGVLSALRQEQQNALIELEVQGGRFGHLLLQAGRFVYAQQGERTGAQALAVYRQTALGRLRVLVLNPEQATLAYAAVEGTFCAADAFHGVSVDELLRGMEQQVFTGVVALEHGRQLTVLYFRQGRLRVGQPTPEVPRITRVTQIAWQERTLNELSSPAEESNVAPTHRATSVATSPKRPAPVPVTAPTSIVSEYDSVRVWALFQTVMNAQLGERAERVIATTQDSLSQNQHVEPISIQLARQVERVAGSAAAQEFLSRCAPAAPPQPDLS